MLTTWNDIDRMIGAMDLLDNRMARIFSDFKGFTGYRTDRENDKSRPRTNLYDSGDSLMIQAEVPGLNKEDLHVKIQGNYLEISGTPKSDKPEGYSTHRHERTKASFSRSFTLPYDVDAEKVQATLENGVLTLDLPKSEAAKPRQIVIH